MVRVTLKQNKLELKDQWYPQTPNSFGGIQIEPENEQNVYTRFTLYCSFNKMVRFRKQFNIKR